MRRSRIPIQSGPETSRSSLRHLGAYLGALEKTRLPKVFADNVFSRQFESHFRTSARGIDIHDGPLLRSKTPRMRGFAFSGQPLQWRWKAQLPVVAQASPDTMRGTRSPPPRLRNVMQFRHIEMPPGDLERPAAVHSGR